MKNSNSMVRAVDAYYRDFNLYQLHQDMLDDPRGNLSNTELEIAEANAKRYYSQAEHMLGYIKMLFLKDLQDAPETLKDLWYGSDN